jgi:hypothetical protein
MLQTTHAGYQRHPTIEVMKTTQVCEKGGKKNQLVAFCQKPSPAWHLKLV